VATPFPRIAIKEGGVDSAGNASQIFDRRPTCTFIRVLRLVNGLPSKVSDLVDMSAFARLDRFGLTGGLIDSSVDLVGVLVG
jgi:hypothetical protein